MTLSLNMKMIKHTTTGTSAIAAVVRTLVLECEPVTNEVPSMASPGIGLMYKECRVFIFAEHTTF